MSAVLRSLSFTKRSTPSSGATPAVSAAGYVDDEPTRRASGAGIVQRSLSFGKSAARAAAAALTPKPTEENTNDFLAASRARQERRAEPTLVPPVAPPVAPEPPLPLADLSPPMEVSAAPEVPPAADPSAPGSAMVAPEPPATAPAASASSAAARVHIIELQALKVQLAHVGVTQAVRSAGHVAQACAWQKAFASKLVALEA